MKKILTIFLSPLTVLHVLAFIFSGQRTTIIKDIERWARCLKIFRSDSSQLSLNSGRRLFALIYLLLFCREYRNVFYLRIGKFSRLLYNLPPLSSLYICMRFEDFGAGTFIQHGFSTIINAEHIGENCWINQQVTIGYNNSKKYGYGKPWIGDNVRISCGAKVVGKIRIGNNSTIGVNSVVVKNVPEDSVVIPSPTILLKQKGKMINCNL